MATIRKSNRTVACSDPIRNKTATELWLAHDCQKTSSSWRASLWQRSQCRWICHPLQPNSQWTQFQTENSRLETGKISLQPSCKEHTTPRRRHVIKVYGMKDSKDSKSSIAKTRGPRLLAHARLCPISYYEIRHLYYLFLPVTYCGILS